MIKADFKSPSRLRRLHGSESTAVYRTEATAAFAGVS